MFIDYLSSLVVSCYLGLVCYILWDIIKVNNTMTCLKKEKLKLFSKVRGKSYFRCVIEKFHNTYSVTFKSKIYISHNININI